MAFKARVLVVEDEAGARELLKITMQQHFAVDTAANGRQALRKVAAHRYDRALIHVGPPGGNGSTLAEAIRDVPRARGCSRPCQRRFHSGI
jgi:DNA-binding response OmpR family regulator